MDDEETNVFDALAKDAEENAQGVSEKAEMSYEESNAAGLAMEATGINSLEADQDEPVKECRHEILMGSLAVEVGSMSLDAITSNIDPKGHSDNASEVHGIERDQILDEEVWEQKSLINCPRTYF